MTEDNRDADTGKYRQTVSNSDILDAVAALEPASTAEVGDCVGLSRAGVYMRLVDLEKKNQVKRKTIGRTAAWFIN